MLIGRRGVLAALTVVLFAAGCANSTSSEPSSPGPAGSAPSSSSSSSSSSPSAETISGTVAAGVEPNCLLLQGDGKPHLLVFADPALKARAKLGATVTVVGTAEPAQMTTCQQGTPFIVTSMTVDRPGA